MSTNLVELFLLAALVSCAGSRPPEEADAVAPARAPTSAVQAPAPHCATGGTESTVYARLAGVRARYDYELRGPLDDVLRACDAVLHDEMRSDPKLRVERACAVTPLERSEGTWMQITAKWLVPELRARLADNCEAPFPTGFELIVDYLGSKYVNEAACLADDDNALVMDGVAKEEAALAFKLKQLAEAEARIAKECPAGGVKLCDHLDYQVQAFRKQRDAARRILERTIRFNCVTR